MCPGGTLSNCGLRDNSIKVLGCWRRLKSIDLQGNEKICDLSPLAHCPYLEKIEISRCYKVSDLTFADNLRNLKFFRITHGYADSLRGIGVPGNF